MFTFKRKGYRDFCPPLKSQRRRRLSAGDNVIKTNSGCFLDGKRLVSFPLEDKQVVNEHHVV